MNPNNQRNHLRSPSGPPSNLPLLLEAATGTGARFAGTPAAAFSAPRARARGLALTATAAAAADTDADADATPIPGAATFEIRAPSPLAVLVRAFAAAVGAAEWGTGTIVIATGAATGAIGRDAAAGASSVTESDIGASSSVVEGAAVV